MALSGMPFYWVFIANKSGNYDAVLSNAAADNTVVTTGTMTLERFTPDSAVIRVVAAGLTASAHGKEASNVISGEWSNNAGQKGNFTATWNAPADTSQGQESKLMMTKCEGVNNCATWKFANKKGTYLQGIGTWPSGETANLF